LHFSDFTFEYIDNIYCDVSVNKRLDDWISVDLMDLSRLEPPKKENKTPIKVTNGSRPSSPDREMVRVDARHLSVFFWDNLYSIKLWLLF